MRVVWPVLVLLAVGVSTSGCTDAASQPPDPFPTATVTVTSTGTPSAAAEPASAPADDDELADGSARHVVRSGGLAVTIDYTTVASPRWDGDDGVSLQIAVSARDEGARTSKVYLSKATLRFAADDGATSLAVPDPLTDTANIDPGFLVTRPNQYVQIFAVPPIDTAAQHLALATKLEFATLVDKKAKDYTKRSVTDQVTTGVTA